MLALGVAVAVGLPSGCAAPGSSGPWPLPSASAAAPGATENKGGEGAEAAEAAGSVAVTDSDDAAWFRGRPGVLDAWAELRPGRETTDVRVALDAGISGRDLLALTESAVQRRPESVEPGGDVVFWYSAGEGRRFSSLGGAMTAEIFLAYRTMDAMTVVSVRGDGDGGALGLTLADTGFVDVVTRASFALDDLRERGADSALRSTVTSADGRVQIRSALDADLSPLLALAISVPDDVELRRVSAESEREGTRVEAAVSSADDRSTLEDLYARGAADWRSSLDLSVTVDG